MKAKPTNFKEYSNYYDLLYAEKDYQAEVDFIEGILRDYSIKKVKTILDCGCGTGGHAIALAEKGFNITGIDLAPGMLRHARQRAREEGLKIHFRQGDLRSFALHKKFNACICMFAVLGYITTTADVIAALRNIRAHLPIGALFILDVWNGLAVMRILPSEKVKVIEDKGIRLIRIAQPELDAVSHTCKVNYRLIISRGNQITKEVTEQHIMRYFFPQEIKHYLEEAGLEVIKICPFLDLAGKVDENVWNINIISRAV
jgi:2-polyprenyl-3-methyl-5-hydroxy-6-metoxy-1,4-benzoquinol methylase